mmetsp:Transcript_25028/g.38954  ORF Transcript_25028/g.38954 Transcript_25028/m.38954 type:complete len:213 (-) Transcript_25028:281-919(-)
MKSKGRYRRPLQPNVRIFSRGPVTRTRNVTQNAIKLKELCPFAFFFQVQQGKLLCRSFCDQKAGALEAFQLMNKGVASLFVNVICNHQSSRQGFGVLQNITVQKLDNLASFGTRSRTHVQNSMIRFNVQQERGDHTHCLLPRNQTTLCLGSDEAMEILQLLMFTVLSNFVSTQGVTPTKVVGIPREGSRGGRRPPVIQCDILELMDEMGFHS